MMLLIFSELRSQWRAWVGVFILAVAAGFVLAIGASIADTGAELGGKFQGILSGAAATILMFSGVSALAVLSSVATLTVTLQQRSYALWQLIGARPRTVGIIVLLQLLIVSLVGAALGVAVARPAADPLFALGFGTVPGLGGVHVHFGGVTVLSSVLGVCGIVLLGGWRAARRAAFTPPLEILRDAEPRRGRMRGFRWIFVIAAVTAAYALSSSLFGATLSQSSSRIPLITPVLTIFIVAIAPLLYPAVLMAWTAVLPARVSSAWFLARHQARYRLAYSTAAITPLLVGISLSAGLYTAAATLDDAFRIQGTGGNAALHANEVALLLGGPLLLAAVAAAIVVFMSSRTRGQELALLQASGATHRTIIFTAALEAVIYVITAAILALAIIVASSVILAAGLSTAVPGTTATIDAMPGLIIAGIGCALILLATLGPTIVGLRKDVMRTLSAE